MIKVGRQQTNKAEIRYIFAPLLAFFFAFIYRHLVVIIVFFCCSSAKPVNNVEKDNKNVLSPPLNRQDYFPGL